MTTTKTFVTPQKIFIATLCLAFVWHRGGLEWLEQVIQPIVVVAPARPAVDVATLPPAFRGLYDALGAVSAGDREILGQFYAGLSRAVAADPANEPVLLTTEDVRKAHRAGLLFLWRGMADNEPNKYAGLNAGLSGVLSDALGAGDVPLNPAIRQAAVACFDKVASLCTNARR